MMESIERDQDSVVMNGRQFKNFVIFIGIIIVPNIFEKITNDLFAFVSQFFFFYLYVQFSIRGYDTTRAAEVLGCFQFCQL